ncbi:MAG: GAF domain-containing protein [Armatimonadetes bacterium]|nr:GAF domain-containing protein [Armatimonadota bacterium]
MASDEHDSEARRMQAELARAKAEIDRLRNELAARVPSGDGGEKAGLLEGTLFISEVEVRSAIARQLRNGARLLQATVCVYLLFDGLNDLVAQRPALGLDEEQLGKFRCAVNRGLSGEVFHKRQPTKIDQLGDDPRAAEEPLGEIGMRNGVCVPLLVQIRDEENRVIDTRAIGVLWVINRRGASGFSDDDVRLLEVFARQVAAVVSNADYVNQLETKNKTLSATFENLNAGILFVGADERIQLINGPARQLFGIPEGRGIGEAYYRLIGHHGARDLLGDAIRKDEDQMAWVNFDVAEEQRVYQIQVARVRGEEDALNGVVAILDDVTEMRRLDQMKSEFVHTFSTELLGPLTSIQAFSAMLQRLPDEFGGEMRREIHGVITGECTRLRRHIGDLLNVSRFEHGIRVHLNAVSFDFGAMLRRLVEREAVQARQHRFVLDLPEHLPPVIGDEQRLEDVAYNLLNNAVKYSPDGGEVRVAAAVAGHGLRIEVRDAGVGISKEQQEQVFQKFARLQPTDERVRGGRGIGLFVSRAFVEAHGGSIGLESEPGKGSTFWFTVPFHPPADGDIRES